MLFPHSLAIMMAKAHERIADNAKRHEVLDAIAVAARAYFSGLPNEQGEDYCDKRHAALMLYQKAAGIRA